MIGRLNTVVLDCPQPKALGEFYAELTGLTISDVEADWVDITGDGQRLSFQLAPDHVPPRWPDPAYPQQFHIDVAVEDIDSAHEQVLALGARLLDDAPQRFRVYADPAGHPFCLVW
jgi:hypothetical protein